VFARINFLLGLGLLILTTFYFVGVYVVIAPLSAFAPQWVKPVAGVAILAAVGITVQLLSMVMSDLRGIGLYNQGERPGVSAYLSQAILIVGHGALLYWARGLLSEGTPIAESHLLVVALVYLTGATLGLLDWRRRKAARRGPINQP
jgi:hypothetical protein